MCGFVFFRNTPDVDICSILDSIKYRGPDVTKHLDINNIKCGFNRLSIINNDADSDQPMLDVTGRYLLLFNGELYNHKKIGKILYRDFGISLSTTSDTEVILKSLIYYGVHIINDFDGIFSIIFVDLKYDTVLLVRDRFGVKPLYYSCHGDTVCASSEIKPMYKHSRCDLDYNALASTLSYGVSDDDSTVFQGVNKVLPGQFVKINSDGVLVKTNYFSSAFDEIDEVNDCEVFQLINSTIEEQIPACDYGVMFSGGVDSSLLLALTGTKENYRGSFSVNVDHPDMSEEKWQNEGLNHLDLMNKASFLTSKKEDFSVESLIRIAKLYDVPVVHPNYIGAFSLMKQASEKGLNVMLSGEGADEVFLGYKWFLDGACNESFLEYVKHDDLRKVLIGGESYKPIETGNMRIEDIFQKIYMQKWLVRQDLSGMANGIEVRVPFLGNMLGKYMNSLSYRLKTQQTISKYYLKKYLECFFGNEYIYRKKIGFDYPLNDWITSEHYDYLMDNCQYFNKNELKSIYAKKNESFYNSRLLFVLVMYVAWINSLKEM